MQFLTREEELTLISSWQSDNNERAMERLLKSFTPLVKLVVKKFRRGSVPEADLMQEGFIGLMKAVDKFDPDSGNRLGTYARWWILATVTDAMLAQSRIIHPGTTQERKKLFFAGHLPFSTIELDMPVRFAEGLTLADTIPSDDPQPDELVQEALDGTYWKRRLYAEVARLPGRERAILEHRWLSDDGGTLDEIGRRFGVSKERVRQLEARAIESIKARMLMQPEGATA